MKSGRPNKKHVVVKFRKMYPTYSIWIFNALSDGSIRFVEFV